MQYHVTDYREFRGAELSGESISQADPEGELSVARGEEGIAKRRSNIHRPRGWTEQLRRQLINLNLKKKARSWKDMWVKMQTEARGVLPCQVTSRHTTE